jgi:hypothetical protein
VNYSADVTMTCTLPRHSQESPGRNGGESRWLPRGRISALSTQSWRHLDVDIERSGPLPPGFSPRLSYRRCKHRLGPTKLIRVAKAVRDVMFTSNSRAYPTRNACRCRQIPHPFVLDKYRRPQHLLRAKPTSQWTSLISRSASSAA